MFRDRHGSITVRLGLIGLTIVTSLSSQTNGSKYNLKNANPTDILIEAKGLKKNEKAPLLVFLHGMGGSPQGLEAAFALLSEEGKFTVFLPSGTVPVNYMRDGYPGFNYDPDKDAKNIARKIKRIKGIDKKQVYLAGFSAGAIMSYVAGTEDPGLYSGVVAFSGAAQENVLKEKSVSRASSKLPIFIVHGKQDKVIPIQLGREAYDYFRDRGFRVSIKELKGGHNIPSDFVDIIEEAVAWFNDSKAPVRSGG